MLTLSLCYTSTLPATLSQRKIKIELKQVLLITLLFTSFLSQGQGNKEWQYPQDIKFGTYEGDTSFYGGDVSIWRIKKGDTLYEYYPSGNLQSISLIKVSNSFQLTDTNKVEKTINEYERNGVCKIFFDDTAKIIAASGQYENNKDVGLWTFYNKDGLEIQKSYPMTLWRRSDYFDDNGNRFKQIDRIETIDSVVEVREVEFVNGQEKVIYNKTLFAKIYLRFTIVYFVLVFFFLFSRVFINSKIYNRENGTSFSPIYFHFGPLVSRNFEHSLLCTFTFWFLNYKPENRRLVIISNTFSVVALGLFFGSIIGLAISGEI